MKTKLQRCRSTRAGRKYLREVQVNLKDRIKRVELRLLRKVKGLDETIDIVARNLQQAMRNWRKGREDQ